MDERLSAYLKSLEPPMTEALEKLEKSEKEAFVPIIRKEEQSFLRAIIELIKPGKILEIGTGSGFSALFMREYAGDDCEITTIEYFPARIEASRKHFEEAGADNITLIPGDALVEVPKLSGEYDLIFLDGAKGQYPNLLPYLKSLLRSGGVLLTDNVLQEGTILDSRYIIKQRDRTIHSRMREYLYLLKHDDELTTSILPMGDGLAFSIKK